MKNTATTVVFSRGIEPTPPEIAEINGVVLEHEPTPQQSGMLDFCQFYYVFFFFMSNESSNIAFIYF